VNPPPYPYDRVGYCFLILPFDRGVRDLHPVFVVSYLDDGALMKVGYDFIPIAKKGFNNLTLV
jgi:hypothetical protein